MGRLAVALDNRHIHINQITRVIINPGYKGRILGLEAEADFGQTVNRVDYRHAVTKNAAKHGKTTV